MLKAVILTDSNALSQFEFNALIPLISPEKQKRIKQFNFFRDAQNALLGDILARAEICRATALSNKQLVFSTNEYGKPFLANIPHINYNISHAGSYVACAIDDNKAVGIDIEIIKPVDIKIAEQFFSADEADYIKGNQQMQRFFEIWTKKESRIKWEGKGLSRPLPSFSVFDPTEKGRIVYHRVFHNHEATCHICSASQGIPLVRVISTAELLWQARTVL